MAIFTLKAHDTRPVLEVLLKNPDGTAFDLTGSTAWKLHIYVSPTLVVTRDMVKVGGDTAGRLQYAWVTADWGTNNLPNTLPPYQTHDLEMEYEVIGGTSNMTFPNDGYDTLKIVGDLA